jgi:hypothetical protein
MLLLHPGSAELPNMTQQAAEPEKDWQKPSMQI